MVDILKDGVLEELEELEELIGEYIVIDAHSDTILGLRNPFSTIVHPEHPSGKWILCVVCDPDQGWFGCLFRP